MRTLNGQQKKFLRIYDNLRYDAAHFAATPLDPDNFAKRLLDDFMQHETFKDALRSIAVDFGRQDFLQQIDSYTPSSRERFGAADALVAAVEHNDDDMLVDLIKEPLEPTYSLTELDRFWHITANMQAAAPELHTHMLADPRYMAIFDQTVAANEYSADTIAPLRAETLQAHRHAAQTLDTMEYDVFQIEYVGMADEMFQKIGNAEFDGIGEEWAADAPQTIFSGLSVPLPMPVTELTEIVVSYDDYYDAMQDAKNIQAEAGANAETDKAEPEPDAEVVAESSSLSRAFIAHAAPIAPDMDDLATVLDEITVSAQAEPDPVPSAAPEPASIEEATYTVQAGDNLWKIAKSEYGLTSYKDIMRTVEHIAHKNGLGDGVDANRLDTGQTLSMPSAEDIAGPVHNLDWQALDADTANRRSQMALANNF